MIVSNKRLGMKSECNILDTKGTTALYSNVLLIE